MTRSTAVLILVFLCSGAFSQVPFRSGAWVADAGNGTYRNPVLHADYSDPDVIRVGNDYYMTSSSFEDIPGLPILHSKDLVNWRLIGHALPALLPRTHYGKTRHGGGVWAPALRYHRGEFFLYYPDPDFGIFLLKAPKAEGPWSAPVRVLEGKGLIDPCPFWDSDGKAYLVHAFAGSRAGIKSVLALRRMSSDGTSVLDEGTLIYDGHELDPTIEGPKLYKRGAYYYVFAPAGGVSTGWQLVLRSRSIYGPYERKVVMAQGGTSINGPHQGAWVATPSNEHWFLHFQDKGPYGRVVHLQPMTWKEDWPVIGLDPDGDGTGEPVTEFRKPAADVAWPVQTPPDSDEFNGTRLGRQWQWMANPGANWAYPQPGSGRLRLYTQPLPDSAANLWGTGSVLQQKFPAPAFSATAKVQFHPAARLLDEKGGMAVMGLSYFSLSLKQAEKGMQLVFAFCEEAEKGVKEKEEVLFPIASPVAYLRLVVRDGARCQFQYSADGIHFQDAGPAFTAREGRWKGAKVGIFAQRQGQTNDSGWMDVDWFRVGR
jgi:beta-xylosidase